MTNLIFWLVFGVNYSCQSSAVEYPEMRQIRPAWGFITMHQETACNASKDVETTMELMGINPFDAVKHEAAPVGLELD